MAKINGYSREEAESFVKYICQGKGQGKTLTRIFEEYAAATHRAKGSVRNYYYALLKSTDNAEVREILKGTSLRAEDVRPFTDEETDKILREILRQKSKGVSVRRAVLNLADGDDKLMLRYQNKYRNMLKKQPDEVRAAAQKLGLPAEEFVRPAKSTLERRVEAEINALYDRLALGLREENARLRETVRRLSEENDLLRRSSRVKKAMQSAQNKEAAR